MRLLGDWKWYAALAALVLFAAFVVFWPGPVSKPSVAPVATTAVEPRDTATNLPSTAVPDPTPAEYDDMLQYTVQDGDTAASIAHLFVVSEDALRRVNHIPDGGDLTVGRKIWVPTP